MLEKLDAFLHAYNAVRNFQQSYYLDVDGIWGKQCWGVIEQGWIYASIRYLGAVAWGA